MTEPTNDRVQIGRDEADRYTVTVDGVLVGIFSYEEDALICKKQQEAKLREDGK